MTCSVVTISNRKPQEWYYLYDEYHKSLGNVQPIHLRPVHWGGLSTKPKVLYQAIVKDMIPTDYIIFTDCWDLVFAAPPEEIMERYLSFNADVVVSTESNCFPTDTKEEYDALFAPTQYKYLNSGFIVGKKESILTCLEAMDLPNMPDDYFDPEKNCNVHPNDQLEWQKVFLKQPVSIALDYYQALSQTLHDVGPEVFDFSEERIRNKITNSYPCTFHFNGGAKTGPCREVILKHLKLTE